MRNQTKTLINSQKHFLIFFSILNHIKPLLILQKNESIFNDVLWIYTTPICPLCIIIFPTRMSNKPNMMNHQYRDWILSERNKIVHGQNKVILPRLNAEDSRENSRPRKSSLRRKEEDSLPKNIKDINIVDTGRYRLKPESRLDTSKTITNTDQMRDAREEKIEIMKEMKAWIKTIETASQQGGSLAQNSLPKLENALYKWCLFIQQNFSCYQRAQYTPPLLSTPRRSEDIVSKSAHFPEGQLKQQRELYEKEIRRLSMRIQETENEIEANRANNVQSLARIADLQRLFVEWSDKVRRDVAKEREETEAVDALLDKNEQFLHDLKQTLAQGKETTLVVQKIEQKLRKYKEFKSHMKALQ